MFAYLGETVSPLSFEGPDERAIGEKTDSYRVDSVEYSAG